ncbi:antibiotic biosynthesis monooxygenase family protein [Flavivirga eckloniae]|uniref:ABM domain-containing protein n=1 Tax=Flavivirga eckloniae TaxID=1803846 RepID=A0A2K9PWE6_9FLAO|nr:hypothetical protein [Flavivirga eckloniae]AUP81395.1 hypothetical protein C1H87_22820 [Flavivirga eckloniae]
MAKYFVNLSYATSQNNLKKHIKNMRQLLILTCLIVFNCNNQKKETMQKDIKKKEATTEQSSKEKIGTIVLVTAKNKPEYTREKVLELSRAIDPIVDEFDGYLGRKMAYSYDEPDFLTELVYYTDVNSFEEAADIEMKSETCLTFFNTMIPDPKTNIILVTTPLIITDSKPGNVETVELVLFKTKPEFDKETVVNAAKSMNAILENYEGYISRKLSRTDDGQWMDVVYWTDLESAKKASKHIMENNLGQIYFGMIDESTMKFYHLDVVIDTER